MNTTVKSLLIVTLALTASWAQADQGLRHQSHALTLWWVIFNNPDACLGNPGAAEQCGPVDVFGQDFLDSVAEGAPNPGLLAPNLASEIAVVYATGGATDPRTGRILMAASIYRTDTEQDLGGSQVVDPMGLGKTLTSRDAEIHLVVRDHGRVDQDGLIAQISNFLEPYCSDPVLLFEGGDNTCRDIQFAIFAPGETGQDSVHRMHNGSTMYRSAAYLFRQGDVVQAIVDTKVRDRRK